MSIKIMGLTKGIQFKSIANLWMVLILFALSGCDTIDLSNFQNFPTSDLTALAADFCKQNGGTWQIRQNTEEVNFWVCVFEDQSECEGTAFYRGECHPGENLASRGPNGPQGAANMPNPASQHCEQNGGTLQIRVDPNGGEHGVCVFPDNTECEEWAFFRGECNPDNSQKGPENAVRHTYSNATLGFNLDAPAGWTVWEAPNLVQFKRQGYTLSIGFWPPDQKSPQLHPALPTGDFQNGGQFMMTGLLLPKRNLVQNGTIRMVDFGEDINLGTVHFSIWLDGPNGQGKNTAEIPAEIIAEAEAILNSITFNW